MTLQDAADSFFMERAQELINKEREAMVRLRAIASLHERSVEASDICVEDQKPWPCPTITYVRATPASDSQGYEEMVKIGA
jgi:hypothetical protein